MPKKKQKTKKNKQTKKKHTLTKRFFRKKCTNGYEWLHVNTYCSPCFNSSVSNKFSLRRLLLTLDRTKL